MQIETLKAVFSWHEMTLPPFYQNQMTLTLLILGIK